jgi:hypothetical protein
MFGSLDEVISPSPPLYLMLLGYLKGTLSLTLSLLYKTSRKELLMTLKRAGQDLGNLMWINLAQDRYDWHVFVDDGPSVLQ